MVVLTLTKRFTQWLGPVLFKNGLKARCLLGGGIASGDNLYLDHFVGLTTGQWMISLDVRDKTDLAVSTGYSDASWMDYWFFRKGEEVHYKDVVNDENNNNNNKPPLDEAAASNLRCAALEKFIRPLLLPNEKWSDVEKWCFHHRILKWLRKEYLHAKHIDRTTEAFLAFPELRQAKQMAPRKRGALTGLLVGQLPLDHNNNNNSSNDFFLPTSYLLQTAFGMKQWTDRKMSKATKQIMEPIAKRLGGKIMELRGGALCIPVVEDQADVSALSLGEILELAGGHVLHCGPFNVVCEESNIFQLWTNEYVDQLALYLLTRANDFDGETLVLDVGAGDGILADSLRECMMRQQQQEATITTTKNKKMRKNRKRAAVNDQVPNSTPPPEVIAIDDGSWQIFPRANVEKIGLDHALKKYCGSKDGDDRRQVIVICSWMPMALDWTKAFRNAHVSEYILIGECDDGQCGDNWETWGNPHMRYPLTARDLDDDDDDETIAANDDRAITTNDNVPPPYQQDGYQRFDMDSLVMHQFSRFDSRTCKAGKTVSFRRRVD